SVWCADQRRSEVRDPWAGVGGVDACGRGCRPRESQTDTQTGLLIRHVAHVAGVAVGTARVDCVYGVPRPAGRGHLRGGRLVPCAGDAVTVWEAVRGFLLFLYTLPIAIYEYLKGDDQWPV